MQFKADVFLYDVKRCPRVNQIRHNTLKSNGLPTLSGYTLHVVQWDSQRYITSSQILLTYQHMFLFSFLFMCQPVSWCSIFLVDFKIPNVLCIVCNLLRRNSTKQVLSSHTLFTPDYLIYLKCNKLCARMIAPFDISHPFPGRHSCF